MKACRLCGSTALELVLDFGDMPIAHRVLDAADAPEERFPFAVHVCTSCGLAQIVDPIDPKILYSYYNYNFSSWKPEPHLPSELDELLSFGRARSVVEIGCNDGLFLGELRKRGVEKAVGIEPNPYSAKLAAERGLVVHTTMVNAEVSAEIARDGRFDVLVARQVMEHIGDLDAFFAAADILLSPDGFIFADIPDFAPACAMGDCSVLWEEHVNYFTPRTFAALMERHGFKAERELHYNFSGGTLAVLCRRSAPRAPSADPSAVADAVAFGKKVRAYQGELVGRLSALGRAGHRCVVYGAGVRACTATNGLRLGPYLAAAIDDQPERQGKFLPGARIPIVPRSVLTDPSIGACLLAVNAENEEKVKAAALQTRGAGLAFASLCVPNDIWSEVLNLDRVTV